LPSIKWGGANFWQEKVHELKSFLTISPVTKHLKLRLKKKRSYFNIMKNLLILLTVLAIAATPAMAGTQLEKGPAHKQSAKHHAVAKHPKKQLKKKLTRKLAKHNVRKHKVAV